MSYISAVRQGEQVFVWERNDGKRELKSYDSPYYFYIKSSKGEYKSIYGETLSKLTFTNSSEFHQAKKHCEYNDIQMFESDIPVELKILSQEYYGVPAPTLNVTFLDIEVDYNKKIGYSSIQNPYAPINSVALYHQHTKQMVTIAIPPENSTISPGVADAAFINRLNDISPLADDVENIIIFVKDEMDLILELLNQIDDSDVVCGWNSEFYDVPMIGKRLEKRGRKIFNRLAFDGAKQPKWKIVQKFGRDQEILELSGRVSLDYLALFQKFEAAERPSYKLESIADEVLPDLPKLEYEGTLADLYRDDFAYFIRYNIRDTEILKGFEEVLGYVALANEMVHLSTGDFKHVGGTLKLAELATINYCHHQLGNMIVNNLDVPENGGKIQGAFVLLPQVGMHEKTGSVDIASLYPSAIRAINISPETLIGQFAQNVQACEDIATNNDSLLTLTYEDGEEVEHTAKEWRSILTEKQQAVSGSGTVFCQKKKGIIPTILEDWYNQRKVYKAKSLECGKQGDSAKAAYYDRLQYVYKIKLNSFYGALANKYFRFYDLRMGESTTGTGRLILLHQCAKVAEILDGEYAQPDRRVLIKDKKTGEMKEHFGYSEKYSVTYGDTDSTYFATHADTIPEAIMLADKIGELVNDSFPDFMSHTFLCNSGFDHLIETGREIVTRKGIFVDKKRYILNVIDDEGKTVDKMKVMGLDTKKTTLPKPVSNKINGFIERLLKDESWDSISKDIVEYKEELGSSPNIMDIGLPKGIKGIEDYTQEYKIHGNGVRLPGHVAAGIFYNQCREEFEDKESPIVMSGMKIKIFYLNQKYGRFKSLAVPADMKTVPQWMLDNFTVDMNAHITRLIDKPISNIIKAIDKEVPTKQTLLLADLLEY